MNRPVIVSMEEMFDFVDDALLETLGMACGEADKSISCIETTIAGLLALSIGRVSENEEQVRIQVEAYTAFILSVALGRFSSKGTSH